MRVRNLTSKKTLCRDAEVAASIWKKTIGLMFRKSLPKGSGLLMDFSEGPGMHSIWMPFMRFPIDVVFMNSELKVTDVFENVPPLSLNPRTWRVCAPSAPAAWVLEIPAKT